MTKDKYMLFFCLFLVCLYILLYFSKNIFIFVILNITILLSNYFTRINKDLNKNIKILLYLYIVLPSFSLIYIVNNKNILDFVLWLFLLIFFSKISIYSFQNTFENIIIEKNISNNLFGMSGSLLIGIFIGTISSLFLKQNILTFIVINIILVLLINAQDYIYNKLQSIFDVEKKEKYSDYLLYNFNNFTLTTTFIFILLFTNIIKLQ